MQVNWSGTCVRFVSSCVCRRRNPHSMCCFRMALLLRFGAMRVWMNVALSNADRSRTHANGMRCMRHACERVWVPDEVLAARSTPHCVELFRIQSRLICIRCDNLIIQLVRVFHFGNIHIYWQVVLLTCFQFNRSEFQFLHISPMPSVTRCVHSEAWLLEYIYKKKKQNEMKKR